MKLKRHDYYVDLCLEYINLHFEVIKNGKTVNPYNYIF